MTTVVDYFRSSVAVPGPEVTALAGLSARTGASLVTGVIERDGSCLYEDSGDDPFRGGSVIVGPLGDVLAGPLRTGEGLSVDERPQDGVTFRR